MKIINHFNKFLNKRSQPVYSDIFAGDSDKYIARHIVMDKLERPLDGNGIRKSSSNFVHLICTSDSNLMLNIVRQAALVCHFPNFHDNSPKHRTKITILAPEAGSESDLRNLESKISSDGLLGNLLTECEWEMRIYGSDISIKGDKEKPFVDVEIEVIGFSGNPIDPYFRDFQPEEHELTTIVSLPGSISDKDLTRLRKKCMQVHVIDYDYQDIPMVVDIAKARRANIVYEKGTDDRNIFNNNLEDASEYAKLLAKKIKSISKEEEENSWNSPNMTELNKLSNLCCTDCYSYYIRSVEEPGKDITQSLIENIDDMGRTEHARWNVEKLIMGFRAMDENEMFEDGSLTGDARKDYRLAKKQNKVHIDLCSMGRLSSVDPGSIKYDAFLVLAIPSILKSLNSSFSSCKAT